MHRRFRFNVSLRESVSIYTWSQSSSVRRRFSAVLGFLIGMLTLPIWAEPTNEEKTVRADSEGTAREQHDERFALVDEVLVVTGSRVRQRSLDDSMVPIDSIAAEELARQGSTELDMLLRNIVPSFNVSAVSGDAAVVVRPINLRGLAPDHTLVLINGKRRHRGAVILWPRIGVSQGAQGPDLSAIPTIAFRRVEVLRDGASAQYGSDAIAGVVNFMLKDADSGGAVEVRYGEYSKGDGQSASIAANVGFPWFDAGFLNVSMEYGGAKPTLRATQRSDAAILIAAGNTDVANPAQRWGKAEVEDDSKLWSHFGRAFGDNVRVYGHTNYARRQVGSRDFFFRNPNTRSGVYSVDGGATLLVGDVLDSTDGVIDGSAECPRVTISNGLPNETALAHVKNDQNCFTFQDLFPGGFQPTFGGKRFDGSFLVGVRGTTANTLWDFSVSSGVNEVDFFLFDSVNASLGLDTPTAFDPGFYRQRDTSMNLDLSRQVGTRFELASGIEWRNERFRIGLGDEASWRIGPYAAQGFSAGSNGFPGFSPIAAGKWDQANVAIYGEGEYRSASGIWELAAALRLEDFEKFGSVLNGKLAARAEARPNLAFRGSVNTGFRAPTPGQQNAFNVSTQWAPELMELVNNGTIPSTSRLASLRGGKRLEAEKSRNLTVGAVFEQGTRALSADLFRIKLDNRLGITQLFELRPSEVQQLLEEGITSAANLSNFRFFANDFKTRTDGLDVVGEWQPMLLDHRTRFAVSLNITKTKVVASNPQLVDDRRIREIEEALPDTRLNFSVHHMIERFDISGRLRRIDRWYDARDAFTYDGLTLVDLELTMQLRASTRLSVGLRNALDNEGGRNLNPTAIGNLFSSRAPFDTNGQYGYVRLVYDWSINRSGHGER